MPRSDEGGQTQHMNRDEDRIFHGLYRHTRTVGKAINVTGDEVLWLARHPYYNAANWHQNGRFQTVDQDSKERRFREVQPDAERALRYLADKKLIAHGDFSGLTSILHIKVTGLGADRARQLSTWHGRCALWYRDHKDGVAGLLVAALVSLVVSLLVN
jgi:hypothetical protein